MRVGSTRPASTARWSAGCSSGRPTPASPNLAVVAGQVTPEGRDELALHAGARLLALTDRVWQAGEAFARAATLVEEATLEAGRRVLEDG